MSASLTYFDIILLASNYDDAICYVETMNLDEEIGKVSYEAESPDEAAFVIAARELGFEFYERTHTTISLHELDTISGQKINRCYKLLNILEFTSARKWMYVIVKDVEGKLLLLRKRADNVMFERIAKNGRDFEEKTKQHISEYVDSCLRTLILAYCELNDEEYNKFNKEFIEAKNLVSEDQEQIVEGIIQNIEKDLILLGASLSD